MAVCFGLGQRIDICTADSKFCAMCVSKKDEDTPAIDVLPRVRYKIPISGEVPKTPRECALFSHGLHTALIDDEHVCVINMGDRVVRLKSGTQVLS
jgi:hypothetical protein